MGVESGVPDVALGDHHVGALPLHDHRVDQVLIGFLLLDELLNQKLVDAVDPVRHFFFLVLFGTELGLDCLLNDLLQFVVGKQNFIHLLA